MNPTLLRMRIAWRYLRAPNSNSAVTAISAVAVAGVAVATAAVICVLSVFNGFRNILNDNLDTLAPDVLITSQLGKTISGADSLASVLEELPGVEIAMPSVRDNALVIADGREMPIVLEGVDFLRYGKLTSIDSILLDDVKVEDFLPDDAAVSVGVAQRLGIFSPGQPLFVFTPKREGRVNISNPASSFFTDSITAATVFRSLQSEFDENTVIADISRVRDLFQYTDEATTIEIKGEPGVNSSVLAADIRSRLGDSFVVKDRPMQQEVNFRMVSIEKWITFLMLTFILVIASFNIISTLCMVVINRRESLGILSSLGMKKRGIGGIFWWESIYITFTGGFLGIVGGLILCLIQQHFGVIKLAGDPSSLIMDAYPVAVEWADVGVTFAPILVIGLVTSWIASRFAVSRIRQD